MIAVNQIQLKISILILTFLINMMITKGEKDIVDIFEIYLHVQEIIKYFPCNLEIYSRKIDIIGHIFVCYFASNSFLKGEKMQNNPLRHGYAKTEFVAFVELDKNVFSNCH